MMSGSNRRIRSANIAFVFAAMMVVSLSSAAQQGQNAVMDSGNHPQASPSFLDATQFSGADPCVRIFNTFGALPTAGGTVDARGLTPNAGTSTLTCSVNPIPSNAKGRLLLGSGTYLAQVPWVIQSYDVNILGTGGGVDVGNTNTTIQACISGQSNCGGKVFPSGRAVIEVGPLLGGGNVFQVTVKELNIDCHDAPGASGLSVIAGQEETVFDLVRASGCRIAGFDIGQGDTQDQRNDPIASLNSVLDQLFLRSPIDL
jgi:hypothetical protein